MAIYVVESAWVRLPGAWAGFRRAAHGVTVVVALLAAPVQVARLWPWPLTSLTGRAVGTRCDLLFLAGLLAVGVTGVTRAK